MQLKVYFVKYKQTLMGLRTDDGRHSRGAELDSWSCGFHCGLCAYHDLEVAFMGSRRARPQWLVRSSWSSETSDLRGYYTTFCILARAQSVLIIFYLRSPLNQNTCACSQMNNAICYRVFQPVVRGPPVAHDGITSGPCPSIFKGGSFLLI